MIKVIPSASYDYGQPAMQLVDVLRSGRIDLSWSEKRASMFLREIADLKPERDHSYLHLLAMSAMESTGVNRNSDGFNEKIANFRLPEPKEGTPSIIKLAGGLMAKHATFVSHGHVYKHHKNTDPLKSIGNIKYSVYNPDMRRVELIIRVPHNDDWNTELQKLAEDKDVAFSMACKVPYDICTICGNRAPSKLQYCDHMKNHATEYTKSGHQVGNINDDPTFFDISKVWKPADRVAYAFRKVASSDLLMPMTGADLAEELGLGVMPGISMLRTAAVSRKLAAADKLAEIEKVIEGIARASDNQAMAGACAGGDIDAQDMQSLSSCNLCDTLQSLSDAKICLSVKDFFRLLMGEQKCASMAGDISTVEEILPGLFSRLTKSGEAANTCASDDTYSPSGVPAPRHVRATIEKLAADHSVSLAAAQRRSDRAILFAKTASSIRTSATKTAAVSKQSQLLANEYAKYVIAFAGAHDQDPVASRLTVLRNYLTV